MEGLRFDVVDGGGHWCAAPTDATGASACSCSAVQLTIKENWHTKGRALTRSGRKRAGCQISDKSLILCCGLSLVLRQSAALRHAPARHSTNYGDMTQNAVHADTLLDLFTTAPCTEQRETRLVSSLRQRGPSRYVQWSSSTTTTSDVASFDPPMYGVRDTGRLQYCTAYTVQCMPPAMAARTHAASPQCGRAPLQAQRRWHSSRRKPQPWRPGFEQWHAGTSCGQPSNLEQMTSFPSSLLLTPYGVHWSPTRSIRWPTRLGRPHRTQPAPAETQKKHAQWLVISGSYRSPVPTAARITLIWSVGVRGDWATCAGVACHGVKVQTAAPHCDLTVLFPRLDCGYCAGHIAVSAHTTVQSARSPVARNSTGGMTVLW